MNIFLNYSCLFMVIRVFLQKIIRRAKLHAATSFVKFAQFAVLIFSRRQIIRIKRINFYVVFYQKPLTLTFFVLTRYEKAY